MNKDTRAMYDLDNAVHNLLQAAKKVKEEWDNENVANQEFDEYPFAENFEEVIDKLQRWSDEVGGFYTQLKQAEERIEAQGKEFQ
jgi:hypothetical protein